MPEKNLTGKPLKVTLLSFVIDVIVTVFWVLLAIACSVEIILNSVPLVALVIVLIPLLFISISIKCLRGHFFAKRITLRERGIELYYQGECRLLKWEDILCLRETRRFGGGLTIKGRNANCIVIPFEVQDYEQIRKYVVRNMPLESRERQSN